MSKSKYKIKFKKNYQNSLQKRITNRRIGSIIIPDDVRKWNSICSWAKFEVVKVLVSPVPPSHIFGEFVGLISGSISNALSEVLLMGEESFVDSANEVRGK